MLNMSSRIKFKQPHFGNNNPIYCPNMHVPSPRYNTWWPISSSVKMLIKTKLKYMRHSYHSLHCLSNYSSLLLQENTSNLTMNIDAKCFTQQNESEEFKSVFLGRNNWFSKNFNRLKFLFIHLRNKTQARYKLKTGIPRIMGVAVTFYSECEAHASVDPSELS